MTDVLAHRGPDDRGSFRRERRIHATHGEIPGVALGFRRLSVIDLAGGHQPMANEDESIWVIFNGEVYNHRELRRRLEGSGHRFRSQSDTEVIVHLYEDEGEACFSHLNGMFAIAIWDEPRRKLVLGRDRLGQKPLVYTSSDERFAFASELKSLLQLDGVDRTLDPNALDEYLLYQYIPHPRTIYRHVRKLLPGHYLVYRDGQSTLHRYWRPDFQEERQISLAEAANDVRSLLHESVQRRMQADVPVGAWLSGGVDSSLIVALMREHTDGILPTFSMGFSVPEYDETAYARQVAQHLGTDHHEFRVSEDIVRLLPTVIGHYDEPFADSSAIPTWILSQFTRSQVTVALSGDGGDELFAGYPRYRAVRLGEWLDHIGPLRAFLGARCWQLLPASTSQKNRLRRWRRFTSAVNQPPLLRYLEWIGIFNDERRADLYRDDFLETLDDDDPVQFLQAAIQGCSQRDLVTQFSLADLLTYLPCDLMTKVDMASMAHHLEVRQPFLDHRLVEYVGRLPRSLKMRRLQGKRLLRHAFEDRLPLEIWKRPKMGFGVPLAHWFRHELKALTTDLLLDPQADCLNYFRREPIERMWHEHQTRAFDHSYRLWSLLVFTMWLREGNASGS